MYVKEMKFSKKLATNYKLQQLAYAIGILSKNRFTNYPPLSLGFPQLIQRYPVNTAKAFLALKGEAVAAVKSARKKRKPLLAL